MRLRCMILTERNEGVRRVAINFWRWYESMLLDCVLGIRFESCIAIYVLCTGTMSLRISN